ncbi:MAG: type I-E CRISPR-associated protein Cas7/Cse4/CasC, partial [Deltaproteobacteria bacterium]
MTKIELHILQNFAPSNLNRDDTGAPKDCEFGGHRRARISSQCFKRAMREAFRVEKMLPEQALGARTKRLAERIGKALEEKHGHDEEASIAAAAFALRGAGLGVKDASEDWKTEYLLFVPRRIVGAIADLVHQHWDSVKDAA